MALGRQIVLDGCLWVSLGFGASKAARERAAQAATSLFTLCSLFSHRGCLEARCCYGMIGMVVDVVLG